MAHGRNKYQSRENRARVREILLRDWDPIGVYGIPQATDEYDAYADKAYVMLMDEGATASEIAGYLYIVATEHMGITDQGHLAERCDQVAQLLVQLRPEFGTH
ncbi:hypothetical protein ES707_19240 [subsurface metagenome]